MEPTSRRRWAPVLVVLTLAVAAGAAADEDDAARNRISFTVTREAEVENDRSSAVLAVTDEDGDAAKLADRVNETMAWALAEVRGAPEVSARSGGYRTFPVTDETRIRRWRARQELLLEAAALPALTALIGRLQSRLELASLSFTVSPERQRDAEDRLIGEALAAFRSRAELIRQGLGAAGYEIVSLALHTGGRPPVPWMERGMAMQASREVAPPAVEAGTSEVSVSVAATIQLE